MAAYSVGQQIAIAAFTALTGLGAIVFIFKFRSFKEVIRAGRASQEAERVAEREGKLEDEGALRGEANFSEDDPQTPPARPRRPRARY